MADNPNAGLRPEQKRGIYLTIAFTLVFIAAVLGMFIHGLTRTEVLSDDQLKEKGVFLFETPRSFKPFKLLDYNNKSFTPENLKGKWSLIFFGYTYCPDICPTTMAQLNKFYKQELKGDYGSDLQIIFASADPSRDTPAKLYDYVRYFNKDFIGVTGDFLVLHRLATQLNIPFSKVPGGGDNYQVTHSGNVAIINPKGDYMGFFRAPLNVGIMSLGYESIRASRGY